MEFTFPNKESPMLPKLLTPSLVPWAMVALLLAILVLVPTPSSGQGKAKQPDFIPAGYDDYQNMLDQLGIKKRRKGRDSKVKDTSDEATANPYKESLPD